MAEDDPNPVTASELLSRLSREARSDWIGVRPEHVTVMISDSGTVAIRWGLADHHPWHVVQFHASGPADDRPARSNEVGRIWATAGRN